MSGTRGILVALGAGLAIGLAVRISGSPALIAAAGALRPIGALWLAGLRMTLIPLVFAMVAAGIASFAGTMAGERIVAIAVGVFAVLLAIAAALSSMLTLLILHVWPVPPHALTGLVSAPRAPPPAAPPIVDRLIALVPTNPVAAAAQGEMTPLIVFALLLGFAAMRIAPDRRLSLLELLRGIADAMMEIVGWLIRIAAIGVFVLSLGVTLGAGIAAATLLFQATVIQSAVVIIGIGCCYPIARIGGGIGFGAFARGVAGPQAVAAGTTSSVATLPAMIEAARDRLGLPRPLVGAVLPLAVSTFRFGNVMMVMSVVIFAAEAGGITPTPSQIIVVAGVAILSNIGVMGLPAAAVLYAADAPAFQAMGAPLELLPLLIATSALPDIFDTVCNVTADLAATSVVARIAARAIVPDPPAAGTVHAAPADMPA